MTCFGLIHRDFTTNSIKNVSSYTQVGSTCTVSANSLGTDRMLRGKVNGVVFQNTGAARTLDFRVKLDDGTTTDYLNLQSAITEIPTGNYFYTVDFNIVASSGTSFQAGNVNFHMSGEAAGGTDEVYTFRYDNNVTVDSTQDVDLSLEFKPSIASNSFEVYVVQFYVELV